MATLRATVVALLIVIVTLSSAPGVVGAASDDVTLTVAVENTDGNPVSGADVRVTWNDSGGTATVTTHSNGKAYVDVPAGTNATIEVSHDDYVRNVPYRLTDASEREVSVTVAKKGQARVTVVDEDGRLANARVQLYRKGTYVVDGRTDDRGVLRTDAIEQGEYVLIAFKQGYFRNQSTLTVGEQVNRTVAVERGSVSVTFDVTDDHFTPPRPVANATVSLERLATITTLPSGTATVSAPVNTRLSVSATKDGYETVTERPYVRESERTVELTINREPALAVDPVNTKVVVGQTVAVAVTDEYGQPVANATLAVGGESVGTTDAGGEGTVPIESAGNVTITASRNGLEATTVVEGVPAGGGETAAETTERTTTAPTTAAPTTTATTNTGGPGFTVASAAVALALAVVAVLGRNADRNR
ncbi:MAG: PGF-CTERM sorting domain-containing protein [Haloarculaceae archaeon]